MRIGYVVQRTYPARLTGSEKYIHDIANQIATTDDVTVLATAPPSSSRRGATGAPNQIFRVQTFPELSVPPVRYLAKSAMNMDRSNRLRRFVGSFGGGFVYSWMYGFFSPGLKEHLREPGYDVLHTVAVPTATAWVTWRGAHATSTPFVINPSLHPATSEQYLPFVFAMIHEAAAVIASTPAEAALLEKWGIPKERIFLIPSGFDLLHTPAGNRERFRAMYSIDEGAFVTLVPRKAPEKGALETLRALRSLARTRRDLVVVLLGVPSAPVQFQVDREVARLTQSGVRCLDLGYLPLELYVDAVAGCDVVCQPSRTDSFGLVYLDAWFQRRPVIAADIPQMRDVVQEGETGLLVRFGDSSDVERKLEQLADHPDLRTKLGEAGLKDLRLKYDLRVIASRVRRVYEVL